MNHTIAFLKARKLLFVIGAITMLGAVGTILLIAALSKAAIVTFFESEAGTKTNVTQVSDSSASGSAAIKFGPGSVIPPTEPTCDLNATTANFSNQVSTATAGQTICLASGNYGTFSGTNKAMTITRQSGATPSMSLDFGTNDKDFTLYGLVITYGSIAGNPGNYSDVNNPKNITIKNSTFTGAIKFNALANSNILLDSNTHNNVNTNSTCTNEPARIWFAYSGNIPSGVTVQNSLLDGGNADGIQAGTGFTALRNEFRNINSKGESDCSHTDPIQLLGAKGSIVRGNYIHHTADGIVAYDGVETATIEYNVLDVTTGRYGIELYSDLNSIIRYNTLVKRASCEYSGLCGLIALDHKPADPAGVGTIVVNNIAMGGVDLSNGSTTASNRNNMFIVGAAENNFNGTPVFIDGANPSSWAGYFLNTGSPGKTGAMDGGAVGIRNF